MSKIGDYILEWIESGQWPDDGPSEQDMCEQQATWEEAERLADLKPREVEECPF